MIKNVFEMHMFARIRKSLEIMLVEENAFVLGKCKIQVLSIKRLFFLSVRNLHFPVLGN